MIIFDGKAAAEKIKQELKQIVSSGNTPGKLGVIMVEGNKGSEVYVGRKMELAKDLGVPTELFSLPVFEPEKIREKIAQWASSVEFVGIMVQLPLTGASRKERDEILRIIPLGKDVDGLNPANLELISQGKQTFLPATVVAVEHVLQTQGVLAKANSERFAIVGSEGMVGKALVARLKYLGVELVELDVNVDLSPLADCGVVISCTGVPCLISGELLKKGVVAIDVGYPAGDFQFETVAPKASLITPVPGGIGPLTVAMLLANVVKTTNNT